MILKTIVSITLAIFTSACFAFDETKTKADIPPLESIDYTVGMTYQVTKVGGDGDISGWKVEAIEGNIVTLRNGNCEVDIDRDKPFSPDLEWRDCRWGSGSQTITSQKGNALPLQVGTKFQYSFTGKNDNASVWKSVRICKVKKKYRVSVPMGDFDTFKLVCSDKWRTRTWWISPENNYWVAYKNSRKGGSSSTYEYVSINRP